MAEGRMLKKRIAKSKKFADLKFEGSRTLYLMMLPHLDVEGRLEADPIIFKAVVCPLLKTVKLENIKKYVADMHKSGLIHLYIIDGEYYLQVTRFNDFQTLRKDREAASDIPPPPKGNSKCLTKDESYALWSEWEKNGRHCVECNKKAYFKAGKGWTTDGKSIFEIDHIIPLSKGGEHKLSNMRVICSKCNRGKGDSFVDYELLQSYSGSTPA